MLTLEAAGYCGQYYCVLFVKYELLPVTVVACYWYQNTLEGSDRDSALCYNLAKFKVARTSLAFFVLLAISKGLSVVQQRITFDKLLNCFAYACGYLFLGGKAFVS
jgi:hypothetical protein